MHLSFVIPAYNEEAMLGKCLDSILREIDIMRAKRPDIGIEVVVVDNASTDGTALVAAEFPVRIVHEPQKGLVRARKAGFDSSRGDLVANVDADSMLPPGWLATVVREFEHDPELVALSGPYHFYDLHIVVRGLVRAFYGVGFIVYLVTHHVLNRGAMLQGGNFVIRRDAWIAAGGYDTSLTFHGEDTDVAKRISKHGTVRWTWKLPMHSSGRRIQREGMLKTGLTYAVNFISVNVFGRPVLEGYADIREIDNKE